MNDRHICKGKRTDNGEWVEGYYFEFEGRSYITYLEETIIHVVYATEPSIIDFNMRAFEVDSETICRCTGLPDKNGKKVWENDIVRYRFDNDIGKVFFSDFRASWSIAMGKNGNKHINNDLFKYVQFKYVQKENRVEVIGNIFDNPELLEGGAK